MLKKFFFSIFVFFLAAPVHAALFNAGEMNANTKTFADKAGLQAGSSGAGLQDIIGTVINVFFGFLGIVFLVLVLIAGWKYMNAGGNAADTEKAIKSVRDAIIGLIIILGAYSITYFVFKSFSV